MSPPGKYRRLITFFALAFAAQNFVCDAGFAADAKTVFAKTLKPPTERSNKTFVVDAANGNDNFSGLDTKPFKTIGKAASLTLPGDTVLVKNGTYSEASQTHAAGVAILRSGAPDAWIVFKAFPGHKPVLSTTARAAFRLHHMAYIEINGFIIAHSKVAARTVSGIDAKSSNGIEIENAHHIRVLNNAVRDCSGSGIIGLNCDYLQIEGNTIHRDVTRNIDRESGIALWQIHDFDNKPGYHNIVRRNLCYGNRSTTPQSSAKSAQSSGILINAHNGQAPILLENNICFDNGAQGITLLNARNTLVRHNTCVANTTSAIADSADLRADSSQNIRFLNNIAASSARAFAPSRNSTNVIYQNNLIFNYSAIPAEIAATNIVGKDPQFFKMSMNPKEANFTLRLNSPAIDAAYPNGAAEEDFIGVKRPQGRGIDIGAYER